MGAIKSFIFDKLDDEDESGIRGLCADAYEILCGDYGHEAQYDLCLIIQQMTWENEEEVA